MRSLVILVRKEYHRYGSYADQQRITRSLVMNVVDCVPLRGARAEEVNQLIRDKLVEHEEDITTYGGDLLEIRNWQWTDM